MYIQCTNIIYTYQGSVYEDMRLYDIHLYTTGLHIFCETVSVENDYYIIEGVGVNKYLLLPTPL